jgi:hypothetical protein
VNGWLSLRLRGVTAFFLIYVVALSFIPLVHQLFVAQSSWSGYGTGAYAFQGPSYFVLFNDPYDGSSKPNIHANPSFAPNERISLVEFSDWTSYVDGYNLFNDFNVTYTLVSNTILDISYTRPGLNLEKLIDCSSPAYITVKFVANKEVIAHFELWKWIMTAVNGVTEASATKPTVIGNGTKIDFSFFDQATSASGVGQVDLSRVPTAIEVWPFENGFNKVTVDFINSEMTFTVSGSVNPPTGQPTLMLSYDDLPYLLPIVAIVVVTIYLWFERDGRQNKSHSRRASH